MRACISLAFATVLLTTKATPQNTTLRATVPLVTVPVAVEDRHGFPIGGLTTADFIVLDQGKPQTIHVDVADDGFLPPVALVTLVQTTDLSLSALAKVRKIGAMISESVVGANGEAALITFADQVSTVQNWTKSEDAIAKAFGSLQPVDSSKGRMLDAVEQALSALQTGAGSRRSAILILGEPEIVGARKNCLTCFRVFSEPASLCTAWRIRPT